MIGIILVGMVHGFPVEALTDAILIPIVSLLIPGFVWWKILEARAEKAIIYERLADAFTQIEDLNVKLKLLTPGIHIEERSIQLNKVRINGAHSICWHLSVLNNGAETTLRNWFVAVYLDGFVYVHDLIHGLPCTNSRPLVGARLVGGLADPSALLHNHHKDGFIELVIRANDCNYDDLRWRAVLFVQFQDTTGSYYRAWARGTVPFDHIDPSTRKIVKSTQNGESSSESGGIIQP